MERLTWAARQVKQQGHVDLEKQKTEFNRLWNPHSQCVISPGKVCKDTASLLPSVARLNVGIAPRRSGRGISANTGQSLNVKLKCSACLCWELLDTISLFWITLESLGGTFLSCCFWDASSKYSFWTLSSNLVIFLCDGEQLQDQTWTRLARGQSKCLTYFTTK